MTDTPLSDWFGAMEAAMRIGCSTRTIERLAQAKKLESRLRPQAGSPPVAVYNPSDVARLAAERQPAPAPFVLGAIQDPGSGNGHGRGQSLTETPGSFPETLALTSAGDDPIRQLFAAALRAVLSPPSPTLAGSVAETPWVDVPTAAALLGRSQAYVQKQIKAGRLKAERDRCLVVRRKDLEAL